MEMLYVMLTIQAVVIALLSGINVSMRIQKEKEVTQLEILKRDIQMIEWRVRELEDSFVGVLRSTEEGVEGFIDDYVNEDIKATHEFYVQNEEDIAARYFEAARRKKNVE